MNRQPVLAVFAGAFFWLVGGGGAMAQEAASEAAEAGQASPDASDPTQQARALFREGQAAYAAGEYEAAIEKWQQAYDLDAVPLLQYNLAQAFGRLGDFPNELESLRTYLATDPHDASAEPARARVEALERRLARTGIRFVGVSPEAEVAVDGEVIEVPGEGAHHPVEPGSHRVFVRQRGRRPFEARVEVLPGRASEVRVELDDISEPRPPVLAYSLMGAGGGMLVGAAALGSVALVKSPDAFPGTPEGDRVERMAITTDVLIGVGAAAATTGFVFFLLRERPVSDGYDQASVRLIPGFTASGAQLTLDGRF